jgi:hypothetical protein
MRLRPGGSSTCAHALDSAPTVREIAIPPLAIDREFHYEQDCGCVGI